MQSAYLLLPSGAQLPPLRPAPPHVTVWGPPRTGCNQGVPCKQVEQKLRTRHASSSK